MKTAIEEFHDWWRTTPYTSPRLKKAALAAWLQAWLIRGPAVKKMEVETRFRPDLDAKIEERSP